MTKYVNSLILPDDVIKEMNDKIRDTRKMKVELGFALCTIEGSNVITKGSECIGTSCPTTLKVGKCKSRQRYLGNYHTHPSGPASLSIADMATGCQEDIECVGAARFDRIRCFVRKTDTQKCYSDVSLFKEEEDNIKESRLRLLSVLRSPTQMIRMGIPQFIREFKMHDKDIEEYYRNRLRLLEKNFNRIDIK